MATDDVLDRAPFPSTLAPRPDHVPEDRVIDFDVYQKPPAGICPQQMWFDMRTNAKYPVMWTPHNGGHWIAMEPGLTESVLSEWGTFSTKVVMVPREPMGETYSKYLPLPLDPPNHFEFRRILNENLGAKSIGRMTEDVEELTVALIDNFKSKGRCNFTTEFAEQLPVRIFMRVVDLPEEDLPRLKYLADQFRRSVGSYARRRIVPFRSGHHRQSAWQRALRRRTDSRVHARPRECGPGRVLRRRRDRPEARRQCRSP